jgi:hypothetical protein
MALAEVETLVLIVRAWLVNTSGSSSVGAFIDSGLHLVQEIVDIE